MKNKCNILRLSALVLSAFLLVPVAHAAAPQLVYDNSVNDLGVRFNSGTNEVGDEITLAGNMERTLTSFAFEYWLVPGTNFSLAQARVRFYANDGGPVFGVPGAYLPSNVLFDSGWFYIGAVARATLTFTDFSVSGGNLVGLTGPVPDDFTWSVQFTDLGSGSAGVGVDLYNPPTVGSSFSDYWDNTGSEWTLRTNDVTPINFAAKIYATVTPTRIIGIQIVGNDVQIQFTTLVGRHYWLEATDNLVTGTWSSVVPGGVIATGNITTITHTGGFASAKRFYRIALQAP